MMMMIYADLVWLIYISVHIFYFNLACVFLLFHMGRVAWNKTWWWWWYMGRLVPCPRKKLVTVSFALWLSPNFGDHQSIGGQLCPQKNSGMGTVSLPFGYVPEFFPCAVKFCAVLCINETELSILCAVNPPQLIFTTILIWIARTHITGFACGVSLTHPLLLERLNLCKILDYDDDVSAHDFWVVAHSF